MKDVDDEAGVTTDDYDRRSGNNTIDTIIPKESSNSKVHEDLREIQDVVTACVSNLPWSIQAGSLICPDMLVNLCMGAMIQLARKAFVPLDAVTLVRGQ